MAKQVWEQSIQINASAVVTDRCITELDLQQRWRSGSCESVDKWSVAVGSYSRLIVKMPWFQFSLNRIVVVREPGLIVWNFDGFLTGQDRWECRPRAIGTLVVNRWELQTSKAIGWGWQRFNRKWTTDEMAAQLMRLKYVAEELHYLSGFQ
jgi:Polyketide cyclase / dehydrase and lipid transport